MNAPLKFQTITDENGNPAFVVIPYAEFENFREQMAYRDHGDGTIPHAVVR